MKQQDKKVGHRRYRFNLWDKLHWEEPRLKSFTERGEVGVAGSSAGAKAQDKMSMTSLRGCRWSWPTSDREHFKIRLVGAGYRPVASGCSVYNSRRLWRVLCSEHLGNEIRKVY